MKRLRSRRRVEVWRQSRKQTRETFLPDLAHTFKGELMTLLPLGNDYIQANVDTNMRKNQPQFLE